MMLTIALVPYIMAPNGRKTKNGEHATKMSIQQNFITINTVRAKFIRKFD